MRHPSLKESAYNLIKNNPGLYLHRIIKILDLPNHVITWHLDILVKFGLVKKVFMDNHDVYFHPKVNPAEYFKTYILSNPKCERILTFIEFQGNGSEVTKTGISKTLKIHYNTVTKYLLKLEKLGFIKKEKVLHKVYYRLK
ncbi:MAG: hypothetical protein ACFE8P_14595 [Promethearchaeota archaeon]